MNSDRNHPTIIEWLGVGLLAFAILFLLKAAWPAGPVYEHSSNTPAIPTQDVSRISGFGLPVLTPAPADLGPYALLQRSDVAMNQLQSLAEVQRLVGSSGAGVTATFAYQAPDRLRYQVADGLQSIAIGDTQYYLVEGQAWEKTQRASTLHWPNFSYATDASDAKVEGIEVLDGEPCAVISFKTPQVDLYRQWIGLTSGWLRRQQMFAPGHNMVSTFAQFNEPAEIVAPPLK